ncbi:MAG: SdpI family protein [Anaerococcus vaginalis]|uniref:SdpI family protein n=1 Tax=Anaerococcus vaginalis TaxID=33037 RepID=UPI001DFF6A55|nr:SdpI family protein [Anaerococcus vaginalis]MBS4889879.1 SdpI family protein [Anaerococcus vaginalis]MDU4448092.1 SdpI family protein [Anaerococcus vaginalis]MDU6182908.1 SdpI family protein [Anaerococcus vaginalis]MDU7432710.1 SdpI family protein [Anaerococcus vaginalis]
MKNKIKFKKESIISVVFSILLFALVNFLFYKKMPETIPTHWGFNNEIDGYSSKFTALITTPLLLIFLNIFSCFMLDNDPKNKDKNNFVITIGKATIPLVMLITFVISVFYGLGKKINVMVIISIFVGFLLILIGNYLPKTKRNYTVGIKLPWTLNSDENWNKTHRLAGYFFILGGIFFLLTPFIGNEYLIFLTFMIIVIIPAIYSFYLYKNGV